MKFVALGGAGEIGASCYLVKIDGKRILLDCGLRISVSGGEGSALLPELQQIGTLDAVCVSHAHLDHVGALPIVMRRFPYARCFMTTYSLPLAFTMILDMVMQAEGRWAFITHPLSNFSRYKVKQVVYGVLPVQFKQTFYPFSDSSVTITFFPAGHMLGAAGVLIRGKEGSIFYTGDFSMSGGRTFAGADFSLEGVDVLITETTYGNQNHPDRKSEEQMMAEIIADTVSRDGNVLIPTPALSKAQEILLLLSQMQKVKAVPLVPIFVDGLVRTICSHYEKMIRPGLFFQEDSPATIFRVDNEETRKYLLADSPCIVVTSSGQLVGGPSVSYALEILINPDNAIIFLSYLDEESPAGQIVRAEKGDIIVLDRREVRVNARVEKLVMSAHADQEQLYALARVLNPKKVIAVHGEPGALAGFRQGLLETGYQGKVFTPKNLEVINLG